MQMEWEKEDEVGWRGWAGIEQLHSPRPAHRIAATGLIPTTSRMIQKVLLHWRDQGLESDMRLGDCVVYNPP